MDATTWPLFGLRIATPRLELRVPTDAELPFILEVARDIHREGDAFPFTRRWSELDDPEFTDGFVQHHWRARALLAPSDWALQLCVWHEGQPIGSQGIWAKNFAELRAVDTGSWLGREFQGRGFGTEMRAGVLEFAFEGLGAVEAHSSARIANPASIAVSERLGYEPNGLRRFSFGGDVDDEQLLRLTIDRWRAHRRDGVTVDGLEPCLRMLGAEPVSSTQSE